ncbi:hypothetical protein NNO07_20535 [Pseudomonas resinovorans]|uniref:Uncharacterized protein n=1 Tax=Metapseudomonas resinovorans TaxID=53412 RepID=A0ABT4Y9B6_METRE|nr:hypothetical protein [Pseudomonas resinovorans]MDA8485461.1 hypothetical protein [Pseudomonas resinovorans]
MTPMVDKKSVIHPTKKTGHGWRGMRRFLAGADSFAKQAAGLPNHNPAKPKKAPKDAFFTHQSSLSRS